MQRSEKYHHTSSYCSFIPIHGFIIVSFRINDLFVDAIDFIVHSYNAMSSLEFKCFIYPMLSQFLHVEIPEMTTEYLNRHLKPRLKSDLFREIIQTSLKSDSNLIFDKKYACND